MDSSPPGSSVHGISQARILEWVAFLFPSPGDFPNPGIEIVFPALQADFFYCWATLLAQFNPVAQSCPTLCNPMDCSTPGFPVHHQLPELAETHVHRVSDAIQPFYPLSSLPLLPSFFPSIKVFSSESVLHIRWPKYWSFSFSISAFNEYSGDWFPLGLTGLISLLSKGVSRVFSNITVQKHQLFSTHFPL